MKFVAILFAACQAFRHQTALSNESGLDINQKVYIEGSPVLGDGAGEDSLNTCQNFASQHVSNPDRPEIKVCGTSIKLTAYTLGRCKSYHDKQWSVGSCDKGKPADSCETFSPSDDARVGASQSYIIEQC